MKENFFNYVTYGKRGEAIQIPYLARIIIGEEVYGEYESDHPITLVTYGGEGQDLEIMKNLSKVCARVYTYGKTNHV